MSRAVVVVPCFNEEARLDLDAFAAFAADHPGTDFLFVDDGSRDGTAARVGELAARAPERFSLLTLEHNAGKAEAVRRGVLAAFESGADRVGYWDADLATPLVELPRFARLLDERPEVVLAMGARVKLLGRAVERSLLRHYPGRVFATCASWTLGLPVYDTQCGAKLLRRTPATEAAFAEPFRVNWTFDVELLARLRSEHRERGLPPLGEAVVEIPLHAWRDTGESKVRAHDFLRAFVELARIRRAYPLRGSRVP